MTSTAHFGNSEFVPLCDLTGDSLKPKSRLHGDFFLLATRLCAQKTNNMFPALNGKRLGEGGTQALAADILLYLFQKRKPQK